MRPAVSLIYQPGFAVLLDTKALQFTSSTRETRERVWGCDWSLPTLMPLWMAMIGLLCFDMCLQILHGPVFFAVIIDVTRGAHKALCSLWWISPLNLCSCVTTCAISWVWILSVSNHCCFSGAALHCESAGNSAFRLNEEIAQLV